jgi:hypothetical protein
MVGSLETVAFCLVRLFGNQFNRGYAMEARQALLEWAQTVPHFSFVDDNATLLEKVHRWARNPPASPTLDLRLDYQCFDNVGTVIFSFGGYMVLGQAQMWIHGDVFLATYMDALSLNRGPVMTADPDNAMVNGTQWDMLTPLQRLGYRILDAYGDKYNNTKIVAAGDELRAWMSIFHVLELNERSEHIAIVNEWVHYPPRDLVLQIRMKVNDIPVIFKLAFLGDMAAGTTYCTLVHEDVRLASGLTLTEFIVQMDQELGPVLIPEVI